MHKLRNFLLPMAVLLLILIVVLALYYSMPQTSKTSSTFGVASVLINGSGYNVYVANTPDQQMLGLMNRTNISNCDGYGNCIGMLFVFQNESNLCFWMENTEIPLNQYWISNNTITNETVGVPYSLKSICHNGDWVLETGVSSSVGIGQHVSIQRYLN